jgi:hypothetical protein
MLDPVETQDSQVPRYIPQLLQDGMWALGTCSWGDPTGG